MTSDRNRSIDVWYFAKPKRKQADFLKSLKTKLEQVFYKTCFFLIFIYNRSKEELLRNVLLPLLFFLNQTFKLHHLYKRFYA